MDMACESGADVRIKRQILVAFALVFTLGAVWLARPALYCNDVFADDDAAPAGFCWRTPVTITNNTGSAITDGAARFTFPANTYISQNIVDPRAWDLVATTPGLNEIEVIAQGIIVVTTSPFWIQIPSLPDGDTTEYSIYSGSPEAKRNAGMFMTGGDTSVVTDHADFDLTDDYRITVSVETDGTAVAATLLDKMAGGGTGYRLRTINDGGVLKVEATIDGTSITGTWPGGPTVITMTVELPNLTLAFDGITQVSTAAAVSSTANAENIVVGLGLTGTIHGVRITDNLNTTESIVADWGFDASSMAETSAADPTYTGTVADYGPGGHTLTYTFTRPQTGIVAAAGALSGALSPASVAFVERVTGIFSDPFDTDLFTSTANPNVPFYGPIQAANPGLPDQAWFGGLLLLLGAFLGGTLALLTRSYFAGGLGVAAPFGFAAVPSVGIIDPWLFVMIFMLALTLPLAQKVMARN